MSQCDTAVLEDTEYLQSLSSCEAAGSASEIDLQKTCSIANNMSDIKPHTPAWFAANQ